MFLLIESFVVGLSGAMAPGPLAAAVAARALRAGWPAGPLAAAGHAGLELAVVAGLWLGWLRTAVSPSVMGSFFLLGGAALIGIGVQQFRQARAAGTAIFGPAGLRNGRREGSRRLSPALFDGIIATLGNPYWFLWWLSVGNAYLIRTLPQGPAAPAWFWLGHILSDFAWLTFLSVLVHSGGNKWGFGFRRAIAFMLGFGLLFLGLAFIRSGVLEFVNRTG